MSYRKPNQATTSTSLFTANLSRITFPLCPFVQSHRSEHILDQIESLIAHCLCKHFIQRYSIWSQFNKWNRNQMRVIKEFLSLDNERFDSVQKVLRSISPYAVKVIHPCGDQLRTRKLLPNPDFGNSSTPRIFARWEFYAALCEPTRVWPKRKKNNYLLMLLG
jgi:hypothetical protein